MIPFPSTTSVSRIISKRDLIKKLKLGKTLQRSLIDDVQSICVINDFVSENLHMNATAETEEILVISVQLKTEKIPSPLLTQIARLIPHKIVFFVEYNDKLFFALHYKSLYISTWTSRDAAKLEIRYASGVKRERRLLGVGDNLYPVSKNMEQYRTGYTINDIDPETASICFTNGLRVTRGDLIGDVSETNMRRVQIRETIVSHFQKEQELFEKGIKTLSLFFIDEVAKYRVYDEEGNESNGQYGVMFEEEYNSVVQEYLNLFDEPYQRYLRGLSASQTHTGYFSIDKKGRKIDSKSSNKKSGESADVSAYDLILKNKERLLSFEEPVRFIFSHSALREGWDNPNIFQICTLKHAGDSSIQKRQEVGRGLRLCVDQSGTRMDAQLCGDLVHSLNHKYAYRVTFKSEELVKNAMNALNTNLHVRKLNYVVITGSQIDRIDTQDVQLGNSFQEKSTGRRDLTAASGCQVKYDLLGLVAQGTCLTRRTVAEILTKSDPDKFALYRHNPEEFISESIRLIKEQIATLTVEHITYNETDECYDSDIFTSGRTRWDYSKALRSKKSIQDYVFTDGLADIVLKGGSLKI